MTVLVYRAGVFAADRQVSADHIVLGNVTKVLKNSTGWLGGTTGDCGAGEAWNRWFMGPSFPDDPPEPPKDQDMNALLVNPKGEIYYMDGNAPMYRLETKFAARGHGRELAVGALEMGADAVQAVRVACKYDKACGGGIDTERLDKMPRAPQKKRA